MENKIYNWKNNIIKFLLGQSISMLGSSLVQFAIIWYIARITKSGVTVTISTVASFLPQIIVSLFAGVWADRYNRKILVVGSDMVIALVTLILAIVMINGYTGIALIIVVSAIRSAGSGIQSPSVNALIPQIVPTEHLMRVNSINSTIGSIIYFVSPAIGGLLLSYGEIANIMFIDVVTAVIGITITLCVSLKARECQNPEPEKIFVEIKSGLKYVKNDRFLLHLFLGYTAYTILIVPAGYLNVLMVTRVFGGSYFTLALNEMTFFIGSTVGGILLSYWNRHKNLSKIVLAAWSAFGILTIILALVDNFYIYLCVMFLVGFSVPFGGTPVNVIIQKRVASDMQGRVFSILQLIYSVCMPLGMAIFGPLADIVTIQFLMIVCGIVLALLTFFMFITKSLVYDNVQCENE